MSFNLADLFKSVVDAVPEREALVCEHTRLTFVELDARANRVAHALRQRGIGAFDHAGLYLYNGPEFLEIVLGALKLRAVPININYRYVADQLTYMIDNGNLRALFFQRELTGFVRESARTFPALKALFAIEDGSTADTDNLDVVSYDAALAEVDAARDFGPRSGDDLYIVYTGGATGMPKGVMWRHEDMFFAGLQGGNPGGPPIEAAEDLAPLVKSKAVAMTFMPLAPFIHGAAQWAALIAFFQGGKVVIAPGRNFQLQRVWQLVTREKVTMRTMVGDAMARPLIDAYDLPQKPPNPLIIASAGAVLSDTVKERLQKVAENLPGGGGVCAQGPRLRFGRARGGPARRALGPACGGCG